MARPKKKESELIVSDRPIVPRGSHPIETDEYQMPTKEIVRVYGAVSRWIQLRTTGAIIYGRPRLGKTEMIKFLINNLPHEYDIPIYHIVSLHSKIAREEEFIETLLYDMGHLFSLKGKLAAKRERLINFLLERGYSNKNKQIILFIDEAQCLDTLHYGWLMDYYNKLNVKNICLSLFLVGQEQLMSQKVIFTKDHSDQIVQRFMIDEHHFSGIKTVEDIKKLLKCYDELSEFPKNSGWSFTRYYFPNEFACGERLENFAEEIYELLNDLRRSHNIKGSFEIPMQHMVKTIKIVFLDYGVDSKKYNGWISRAHWREAILNSNYIQSVLKSSGSS